jgi:hypothetical protein
MSCEYYDILMWKAGASFVRDELKAKKYFLEGRRLFDEKTKVTV